MHLHVSESLLVIIINSILNNYKNSYGFNPAFEFHTAVFKWILKLRNSFLLIEKIYCSHKLSILTQVKLTWILGICPVESSLVHCRTCAPDIRHGFSRIISAKAREINYSQDYVGTKYMQCQKRMKKKRKTKRERKKERKLDKILLSTKCQSYKTCDALAALSGYVLFSLLMSSEMIQEICRSLLRNVQEGLCWRKKNKFIW